MRHRGTSALLALWVVVSGCGGASMAASFSLARPEDSSQRLQRAIAMGRTREAPSPTGLAVTADGTKLVAFDVRNGAERWRVSVSSPSVPWLAGRYAALLEDGSFVLRRLADGAEKLRLPAEQMALVGASGEGPWAVAVLSTGGGVGARSRILVFREGGLVRSWSLEQVVGVPWVQGEVAWIPWASQFVSAVLLPREEEIARARLRDARALQAWGDPGGVFVGGDVAVPWSGRLAAGRASDAGGLHVVTQGLPGRLAARPDDPSRPPLPPTSAAHRIGLRWWAARGGDGSARLGNGVVYLVFYRVLMALEPAPAGDGFRVRWARRLDRDVVAAEAGPRTLWVMLDDGRLLGLCAGQGRLAELGRVKGRFVYARLPRLAMVRPHFEEQRPSWVEQLADVAAARDARTAPVQRFAVARLAEAEEASATAVLLRLCEASRVPPQVRKDACGALAGRRLGASVVLAALRRRASFLADRPAPPIGALARAAAAMKAREAVPSLLERLDDPATPAEALPALVEALGVLGGDGVEEGLTAFARFYHAEPGPEPLARAVAAALRVVTEADADRGRALVEAVLGDEATSGAVRAAIEAWWAEWKEARAQEAESGGEDTRNEASGASSGPSGGVEEAAPGGGGGADPPEEERR